MVLSSVFACKSTFRCAVHDGPVCVAVFNPRLGVKRATVFLINILLLFCDIFSDMWRFQATLLLRTTRMRPQRLGGVSGVAVLQTNKQTRARSKSNC